MKKTSSYSFYNSLRFRFGLIFGLLFLCFLLVIVFFLYSSVKSQLEKNFESRLESQANITLQKTAINPLTVPLPQEKEYYLLTYNNGRKSDTLFRNLPFSLKTLAVRNYQAKDWKGVHASRILETGGVINIWYYLPANKLNNSIEQLQLMLFIYVPAALIASFIAGYFLSGFLLKPINHIITKANETGLQNEIELLQEPVTKDELYRLTVALNRMLERIQKQSRQQNAFFASASHELRTPLSVMLTELQTLRRENLNDEINQVLQNQTSAVRRLNKSVNDFLLMSQLKADSVAVTKTIFSIADVCVEMIEPLQKAASQNKQIFRVDVFPSDEDFNVHADRNHLAIVVNNLLANAVKHGSFNSTIEIRITKNEERISLSIQNKADLIIDDVNKLKNEFARADVYKDGFGLGLWIADQLIRKNNGALNLSYFNNIFTSEITLQGTDRC